MAAAPPAALLAQDNLIVRWGDASGWTEVGALPTPHQAEISSTTREAIQIEATFANPNVAHTRQIVVKIPRGYRIVDYSAKTTTPAINGVGTSGFSTVDEAKVNSVTLTASDGTPWASQAITGYSGGGGQVAGTNVDYRPYDGMIVYDFNSTCDRIVLTLSVSVDAALIPHTLPSFTTTPANNSFMLPDIMVVEMTTAAATFNEYFHILESETKQ